jgi:hypothetical protein
MERSMLRYFFQGYADTILLATRFDVHDTRIETSTRPWAPASNEVLAKLDRAEWRRAARVSALSFRRRRV